MFDQSQPFYAPQPKRRRPTAAEKKRRRLIVAGAAVGVVIAIAAVSVAGVVIGNKLARSLSAKADAQVAACEKLQAEVDSHGDNDPQNPDEAQSLSISLAWRSQISSLEQQAPNGPLKTDLQKYLAGLNAAIAYYQTHPDLDMSNQPAQLTDLEKTFTTDGEQARAICSG